MHVCSRTCSALSRATFLCTKNGCCIHSRVRPPQHLSDNKTRRCTNEYTMLRCPSKYTQARTRTHMNGDHLDCLRHQMASRGFCIHADHKNRTTHPAGYRIIQQVHNKLHTDDDDDAAEHARARVFYASMRCVYAHCHVRAVY